MDIFRRFSGGGTKSVRVCQVQVTFGIYVDTMVCPKGVSTMDRRQASDWLTVARNRPRYECKLQRRLLVGRSRLLVGIPLFAEQGL